MRKKLIYISLYEDLHFFFLVQAKQVMREKDLKIMGMRSESYVMV